MKKIVIIAVAAFSLFMGACDTKKEKEAGRDSSAATIDSLQQVIAQTQNESNDLMGTIEQIQEGFRQISEAEGRVSTETKQGEGTDKQAIQENMAFIQRTLRLNRDLIANLQQQLRSTNQTNGKMKATLEEMVANFNAQLEEKSQQIEALRAELAAKEIRIAEQDEQISTLSENVSNLAASNAQKEKTVAEQDKELHSAWYVFGTKKELREQKILEKNDVLRSRDFNRDYFTKIDLRVTKVIKLYSKSARLVTSHPAGSYSLDRDSQGQYTLRITQPENFWSVSRYLVIIVK
ncbi:MAG TPA: hypothetical protein PLN34_03885 [Alloprevotella sp.]|nr:hypothetical protein [Alloprevotella sp.]